MTDYQSSPQIGGMTAVVEMVEAILAAGGTGLPADWRDDFHSPFPGWYLAGHLYNVHGSDKVRYAARAASRSVRYDYCRLDGPDLAALQAERNRVLRLLA